MLTPGGKPAGKFCHCISCPLKPCEQGEADCKANQNLFLQTSIARTNLCQTGRKQVVKGGPQKVGGLSFIH